MACLLAAYIISMLLPCCTGSSGLRAKLELMERYMEVCELSSKEFSELFYEVGAFIYSQITMASYEPKQQWDCFFLKLSVDRQKSLQILYIWLSMQEDHRICDYKVA